MTRPAPLLALLLPLLAAAGCGDRYSPDAYATRAVQQANRVEQGTVAGFRRVQIVAEGTVGAAAGAAAGGTLGSVAGAGRVSSALGTVGGALVGGLVGTATERVTANTDAVEYVVRKPNAELVSVTQRDEQPIPIGTRVLVITGAQARIVPDYTVAADPPASPAAQAPVAAATPTAAEPPATPERSTVEALIAPVIGPPPVVLAPPRP